MRPMRILINILLLKSPSIMQTTTSTIRIELRHSQFVAWVLLALFAWLTVCRSAAADLDFDRLYRSDQILEIEITLPVADWETLKKQTRDPATAFNGDTEDPFTWFKGDITIAGETVRSVGIRKKGFFGSLDTSFPSLKIRFDEFIDQKPINGIDSLTLNNNKQDESLLSQILAYRLFNAAGVAAPKCNLAHVKVNGEDLGLYCNVESIEKPFLKRCFGNNSGNLYEGTLADFYPKSIEKLEVKTNKKNHDRTKVERLAKLLDQDGPLQVEEVEKLINLENFLRYWAMESLLKFWDGYSNNQNNYWIYEDANDGKFRFIPWGADATMSSLPSPPIFSNQQNDSVYAQSILTNRLYKDAATASRYRSTMRELLDTVWQEDEILEQIDELKQLVETRLQPRQGNARFAIDRVRRFVESRRDVIEKELRAWPRTIAAQPRKPAYTIELGTAKGTFQARRDSDSLAISPLTGVAELEINMGGMLHSLREQRVSLGQPRKTDFTQGFGMVSGGKSVIDVSITFTQIEDNSQHQFVLFMEANDLTDLHLNERPIKGVYYELKPNQRGQQEFWNRKHVNGRITLTEVAASQDGPVAGRFELNIFETRGGLFDQRQNQRAQPPKPQRSRLPSE